MSLILNKDIKMVKYYKKYIEEVEQPKETPASTPATPKAADDLSFDPSIFSLGGDIPANEMNNTEAKLAIEDSNAALENGDLHECADSTKMSQDKLDESLNKNIKDFLTNNNTVGLKNSEIALMYIAANNGVGNKDSIQSALSKNKQEVDACRAEYQKATGDFGPAKPLATTGQVVAQTTAPVIEEEPLEPREFTDEEKSWIENATTGYDSDEEDQKREEYIAAGGVLPSAVATAVEGKFGALKDFVKNFLRNTNLEKRLHIILGGPGIGKTVEIFKTIADLTGKSEDKVVSTLKSKKTITFSGALPYAWQSHANPEHIKYITGASSAELHSAVITLFNHRKDYILIFDDYDSWIKKGSQKIPNLFKAVFNTSQFLDKISWREEDLMSEATHIHVDKNKLKEGVLEVTVNDSEVLTEELSNRHALKLCEAFGVEVRPDSWLALHETLGLDDDEADADADDLTVFADSDPADDADTNPANPQATGKGKYDDAYDAEQAFLDGKMSGKKGGKVSAKSVIPEDFYFQSRCLFISNTSKDKIDTAVLSRAKFLDMGIFSAEEFFERLKQILNHLGVIDHLIPEEGLKIAIRDFAKGFIFQLVYNQQEMARKYRKYGVSGLPVYSRQFRTMSDFITAIANAVSDYISATHPVKQPGEDDTAFFRRIVLETVNPTPIQLGGKNPKGVIDFQNIVLTIYKEPIEEE